MLFLHCVRRAASRACWTAGRSRAMRIAMIAITTRSSINVNARRTLAFNIPRLRGSDGKNRKDPALAAARMRVDASPHVSGLSERLRGLAIAKQLGFSGTRDSPALRRSRLAYAFWRHETRAIQAGDCPTPKLTGRTDRNEEK